VTICMQVDLEATAELSPADRAEVEALSRACLAADGIDPGLHPATQLNVVRDMPAWFLAWGKGRSGGRTLVGSACLFAPSRSEGELSAAVSPLWRRQGIFMGLYALAMDALRGASIPALLLAADARRGFGKSLADRLGGVRSHGEHLMALERCDAGLGRQGEAVRLVPVTGAELPLAAGLSSEIFGDEPADALAFVQGLLDDPSREQFLAMGTGGPVGMVAMSTIDGRHMIHGLGVVPAARGAGFGKAILDAALAVLFGRGAERVSLEVDDGNAAAIALYASRGFKDESRTDYWRIPVA